MLQKSEFLSKFNYGFNTKFIILRYDNAEKYNNMFEELKDEGIIVVSISDFSNIKFWTQDYHISKNDGHPNARAWREITPLFVKYLQDRGYLKD